MRLTRARARSILDKCSLVYRKKGFAYMRQWDERFMKKLVDSLDEMHEMLLREGSLAELLYKGMLDVRLPFLRGG